MTRRYLDQRLRLSLLRVVDAVEAQGSLLKASAALGISQPALTKNLQELEDILQLRLFDRHSRGVIPTTGGRVFIQAARRILADMHRLEEDLDQLANPSCGTVALGALPVTASGVLPGVLARLKTAHPDIKIRLQQGRGTDLFPLLASGELDLVVGRLYEPAVPDGFRREPLWSEPISILARSGHPIFSETVSVDSLRRYDLVLPTMSQRIGQEIEHLLAVLGVEPTAPLRSSSQGFIREILHATDSISVVPRLMMVGDLLRGTLRIASLPIPAPDRPAGLILPRGRALPPAAGAFVQCLRGYISDIIARGVTPAATNDRATQESDTILSEDESIGSGGDQGGAA
jgi:LysR family transcriptional regulator, pca operon transcriptional activator